MREQHSDIVHQVLEVIVRSPGTALDDIAFNCPNLTWKQIFITINRLSRKGMVKMSAKGFGHYALYIRTVPEEIRPSAIV